MAWRLEYRDDLGIVVLTYTGRVSGEDIQAAAAARIDLGKEKGASKFLIDTREVETDESATLSIYEIPDRIYPEKQFERTSRIAILGPKSMLTREMVAFFENACVNRGWLVKTFQEHPEAVAWLGLDTERKEAEREK